MSAKKEIEWTINAQKDFTTILNYYKKRSLYAYKLVKNEVLFNLDVAASSPKSFAVDVLKTPVDENIRAFTAFNIRVAYLITKNKIIVLRLRHTSREPKEY